MKVSRYLAIAAGTLVSIIPVTVATYGQFRPRNLRKFRSIVLLGTAQYDGVPSQPFASRIRWAINLWHRNKRLDIVTLGGKLPGDRFSEAEVARISCLRGRVDPEAIIMVPEGNDTESSLRAAADKIAQPALIVTDPLHALRAKLWAKRFGIKARVSATPFTPQRFLRGKWLKALAHECGGVVVWLVGAKNPKAARNLEWKLRSLDARVSPRRRQRYEFLQSQQAASTPED